MDILERLTLGRLASVTYKLIMALILMDVVVMVGLPWFMRLFLRMQMGAGYVVILDDRFLYRYLMALIYVAGLLCLLILNHLRLLFASCIDEEVFNEKNVRHLFYMAIEAGILTLALVSKLLIINSLMTIFVAFAFFMATVFCLVLTLLFDQAVKYKLENDLTI